MRWKSAEASRELEEKPSALEEHDRQGLRLQDEASAK